MGGNNRNTTLYDPTWLRLRLEDGWTFQQIADYVTEQTSFKVTVYSVSRQVRRHHLDHLAPEQFHIVHEGLHWPQWLEHDTLVPLVLQKKDSNELRRTLTRLAGFPVPQPAARRLTIGAGITPGEVRRDLPTDLRRTLFKLKRTNKYMKGWWPPDIPTWDEPAVGKKKKKKKKRKRKRSAPPPPESPPPS